MLQQICSKKYLKTVIYYTVVYSVPEMVYTCYAYIKERLGNCGVNDRQGGRLVTWFVGKASYPKSVIFSCLSVFSLFSVAFSEMSPGRKQKTTQTEHQTSTLTQIQHYTVGQTTYEDKKATAARKQKQSATGINIQFNRQRSIINFRIIKDVGQQEMKIH